MISDVSAISSSASSAFAPPLLRRHHRRNLSPHHCPYSHPEHDRFSPAFPLRFLLYLRFLTYGNRRRDSLVNDAQHHFDTRPADKFIKERRSRNL